MPSSGPCPKLFAIYSHVVPSVVPSLEDLAAHTDLDDADLEWLRLLMTDWQIIADLSFADLVLWLADRNGTGYWAAAQTRPTTGPTALVKDTVGEFMVRGGRPLMDAAYDERRIVREGDPEWRENVPVRVEVIPVVRAGRLLALITRNTNLLGVRTPSRLELSYLKTASDLARMIGEGSFPGKVERRQWSLSPRVGDGFIRLDEVGVVEYASPNALSTYRRLGMLEDLIGQPLGRATESLVASSAAPIDETLRGMLSGRDFRETEFGNAQATVMARTLPLRPGGQLVGALVLIRDVTELRDRERQLVTKDATIREIHHRVKNNLQTVAALLRLQSRRLDEPEGQRALAEAVQRVGSIAMVHEMLSQTVDEEVEFDDIADQLLAMVCEVAAPDVVVTTSREGSFGSLPADIATALALVLTELLTNAVEHGLRSRPGSIRLMVDRSAGRLTARVEDNGVGLPADFDPDQSGSLGISIVRTLVESELGGVLHLGSGAERGTHVIVDLPTP
jgi:two-component system, sensor histidine kinase PdtaS